MSQLSDQGQIKYSQLSCLDDVILGLIPCDVSFIGNFHLRKKKDQYYRHKLYVGYEIKKIKSLFEKDMILFSF